MGKIWRGIAKPGAQKIKCEIMSHEVTKPDVMQWQSRLSHFLRNILICLARSLADTKAIPMQEPPETVFIQGRPSLIPLKSDTDVVCPLSFDSSILEMNPQLCNTSGACTRRGGWKSWNSWIPYRLSDRI